MLVQRLLLRDSCALQHDKSKFSSNYLLNYCISGYKVRPMKHWVDTRENVDTANSLATSQGDIKRVS
jgi:hypothetical protein